MRYYLNRVASGDPFGADEMGEVMKLLLDGAANDVEIAGLLMALRVRGPTVAELAAAVETMRSYAIAVEAPTDAIDTCGTGGDGADTFNISTAVALVAAGAGAKVAKHGSTAASSTSGSAEVLRELGVKLDCAPKTITRCINEAGVGFMFAAVHHSAVKNVMAARRQLGVRTFFNILGPLSNPARTRRQLMGVYAPDLLEPVAQTMHALGVVRAFVVHGADGLDELSTTGESLIAALRDGAVTMQKISPEDIGLQRARLQDLKGGKPKENAAAIRRLLDGETGPFRDIVLLNCAAALVVADLAANMADAARLAAAAIDDRRARTALDALIRISNETA